MRSEAKTVDQYLAELPEDRSAAIAALRQVILENLPKGFEEGMSCGMIGYHVPHSIYPAGYHCDPEQPLPFAGLASQKNHMAFYLMCVYSEKEYEKWFREAWAKSGKKLDMGKSCIRFKKLEDLPLDVVGAAIKKVPVKKYVAIYEAAFKQPKGTKKKAAAKKKPAAPRKASARKK
jgi:hypothetical protein